MVREGFVKMWSLWARPGVVPAEQPTPLRAVTPSFLFRTDL
jgi:hypothetical protein